MNQGMSESRIRTMIDIISRSNLKNEKFKQHLILSLIELTTLKFRNPRKTMSKCKKQLIEKNKRIKELESLLKHERRYIMGSPF